MKSVPWDRLWLPVFVLFSLLASSLARYMRRKPEDSLVAEGVLKKYMHMHFCYSMKFRFSRKQRKLCALAIYFEDGGMCVAKNVCRIGAKEGDRIKILKNRNDDYRVVLES
jgi:hypothetical protein